MQGDVVALLAALLAAASALPARNLTGPEINPGCIKECDEPWVVVTAAERQNDTLQHLWGANKALSFLVVADTGGPEVTVDWDAFQNRSPSSVTFQKSPSHVFGFVIPSLILYNDEHDDGAFRGQNASVRVPVSEFSWDADILPNASHQAAVLLQTTHFRGRPLPNDTRLLIQVAAYGEDGRSSVLPHLLRTPDSAQLDVIFDNFILNLTNETREWQEARWAMDVMVFSSEHKAEEGGEDSGIQFLTQKSLDDEHTPGVFNLDQVTTAGARAGDKAGGYLQWRPVSYLSSERDINDATVPNINTTFSPVVNLTDSLKASLAYAVLGENLILLDVAVTSVISFGQPKDGFYKGANYSTWTVALGEGVPPKETFSALIVTVISLGVGLPAVMFLAGCVVLGVRRYRTRFASNLLVSDGE